MLWTSVSDTLLTFLSWISLGISKTSTPKLAYFSLSLPSMLKYLLPPSPDRGPLGWTVRLLEATTSTPAWFGMTWEVAKRKQAAEIERILMVAHLGLRLGSSNQIIIPEPLPVQSGQCDPTQTLHVQGWPR